jgi:hypothetical protein
VCTEAVHRKQTEREADPVAEIFNAEDVEEFLEHRCLKP